MNKPQQYRLNPKVRISDYKVMGGEVLLTESFRLELDGEMGFAPKSLFVSLEDKRKELEEILKEYSQRIDNAALMRYGDPDALNDAVDRILGVEDNK